MRVRAQKEWSTIALMGGFAEVENDEVTILVNGAEQGSSIEKEPARLEFAAAEERVAQAQQGDNRQEQFQANQALKRSRARYQAAGGLIS